MEAYKIDIAYIRIRKPSTHNQPETMHLLTACLLFATVIYSSVASLDIVGTCDNSNCQSGERCVLHQVQCIRAPCPPIETCIPKTPSGRPGSCPAPQLDRVGICVVRCFGDNSCPGEQKCCGNCPKVCTDPVGIPTEVPTEIPGSCPVIRPGHIGPCVAHCSGDDSCPGDQKCCGSCPRSCTDPISTRVVVRASLH